MAQLKKYIHWLQIISTAFTLIFFGQICYRWLFGSPNWGFLANLYAKINYSFDTLWFKELAEMSVVQKLSGFVVDCVGLMILCLGIIVFNRFLKLLKSRFFYF